MNSISVYGILTTEKFILKHPLILFSTAPLFSFGNVLLEPSFTRDCLHVFREKIQIATPKMKFQGHVTRHNGFFFSPTWCNSPSGVGSPHYSWSHSDTPHAIRTPLDKWWARRRNLYLTTQHSQETNVRVPELTIPASERLQTHALDHAATGMMKIAPA
jgi:hypothetical protein